MGGRILTFGGTHVIFLHTLVEIWKILGGAIPPRPEPSGSTPECKPHLAPTQGTNNTSQKADLRVNGSNNKEYNNNKHKKTKDKVK